MNSQPKRIGDIMRPAATPRASGLTRSVIEPMRIAEALHNIARGVESMSADERAVVEQACAVVGVTLPILLDAKKPCGHD